MVSDSIYITSDRLLTLGSLESIELDRLGVVDHGREVGVDVCGGTGVVVLVENGGFLVCSQRSMQIHVSNRINITRRLQLQDTEYDIIIIITITAITTEHYYCYHSYSLLLLILQLLLLVLLIFYSFLLLLVLLILS